MTTRCTGRGLYNLLRNVVYAGQVRYKTEVHPGEHEGIVRCSTGCRLCSRGTTRRAAPSFGRGFALTSLQLE